jgi:hypothetical protein
VTKAVLSSVAKLRKDLAAGMPKLARGRPASKAARREARRKKRIEQEVSDLFEHRYLFVKRHLTTSERKTLARISRGQRQLRSLRGLTEEVYRLFDRRCLGPRRTRWSEGTRATGRCRSRYIGCEPKGAIEARLALDLVCERKGESRAETTKTLHGARAT